MKGQISLGTILLIAGVIVIVYIGIKVVPVYLNNYFIEQIFEQEVDTYPKQSVSDIYNEIGRKLKDMEHPCDIRLVSVEPKDNSITISAQYSETVELIGGYKKTFTFSPKVVGSLGKP
jgi:hypothetical protein